MLKTKLTYNVNETIELGTWLGKQLTKGCVIALIGDLGVGKTAFTKGLALGLDIHEPILSPTFTLLREYSGRLELKHIDAYRLEHGSADSLALYDLIDEDAVVVIEWSNFLKDDIPYDLVVTITEIDETVRSIKIEGEVL